MKMIVGNNRFYNLSFGGKEYKLIEPDSYLISLFSFQPSKHSYFPTKHWELAILILVGMMGSGKSTIMRYIAELGFRIYEDEFDCFQTNDLTYSLNLLNKDIENRKKVQFIFFDDALTSGMDSRRSMSDENVQNSQNLAVLRHLLANEDKDKKPDPRVKRGFCVVIYAVQSPSRLDKFIRENANLTIYKSYYENLESEKHVSPEAIEFIKFVTEESMDFHDYYARGSALGITKTKKAMEMYFPDRKFEIPDLSKDCDKYEELLLELTQMDLAKKAIVTGFVFDYCRNHSISISQSTINELYYRAKYIQIKKNIRVQTNDESDRIKHMLSFIEMNPELISVDGCIVYLTKAFLDKLNDSLAKTGYEGFSSLNKISIILGVPRPFLKRINRKQKRVIMFNFTKISKQYNFDLTANTLGIPVNET